MTQADSAGSRFGDLPTLCSLQRMLDRLDPAAPPRLEHVWPPERPAIARLGVLAGSFNPLTIAHAALAETARTAAHLDLVCFALSSRTVDKEQPTGMALADRLLMLRSYAETHAGIGVLALNRGLYADQAVLIRNVWPDVQFLGFIIGFDKLVQIFDPRYYVDRDEALDRLFANAVLLVAPRAGAGPADVDALLSRPENRRYQAFVQLVPAPAEVGWVSATAVRERVAAGGNITSLVPSVVATFIAETDVYRPPVTIDEEPVDVYALRRRLIETLCALEAPPRVDLTRVLALAQRATPSGHALRQAIETLEPAALAAALHQQGFWIDRPDR